MSSRRFHHVAKIGVELEGGWFSGFRNMGSATGLNPPETKIKPWKMVWHADGSVIVGDTYQEEILGDTVDHPHRRSGLWEGEGVCNPPLSPHVIHKWIMHNHPEWVNQTCGMHVHMSFKSITDYERLMEEDFIEYFLARMKEWGEEKKIEYKPFWSRLKGLNHYCRKNIGSGQAQVNYKLKKKLSQDEAMNKYYQLNYSAWKKYKTLECRLLPMFKNPKESADAVDDLIWVFEKYLRQPYEMPAKRSMLITESMKISLEEHGAEDKTRVIRIENKDKITKFSTQESESLIQDIVVRTTQDPNMRLPRLPGLAPSQGTGDNIEQAAREFRVQPQAYINWDPFTPVVRRR